MPPSGNVRGRKKTSAQTVVEPAAAVATVEEPVAAPVEEVAAPAARAPAPAPAPAAKKRATASKKPVKVVAVVTPDGIEGSFAPEPRRPLIAHLQIRTNDILFHNQTNQPNQDQPGGSEPNGSRPSDWQGGSEPHGYDPSESNPFCAGQERLGGLTSDASSVAARQGEHVQEFISSKPHITKEAPAAPVVPAVPKSMPCFLRSELMIQFKEPSEQKKLPETTDIACFWCAHPFEGMPCIIPEREVNKIYTVYGNFCCPECAVSYLLNEGLDPHVRWERMSLLHRIYDTGGNGRIIPAPCRESLKLFGGPMSIEVYRATIREKKVRVDMHMPPMVSILGSIDTKPIDFFDTTLKQSGPVGAQVAAAQRPTDEGLRLKRTKPLKDKESTLDTFMNIKISGARGR
jgi:hypothetical protein